MRDIEKYAKEYNQPNFEDFQLQYRRKKILEIIDKYKPMSILEIGCGMEPLFQFLNYKFEHYTIVEPGHDFFTNAMKLSENDSRIQGYNAFFGSDKIKLQQEYDMIICSGLLHEVTDPVKLVKTIAAVATPTTLVHINVPNAKSFHRLLAKEMGLLKDEHEMSERNMLYQQNSVFDMDSLKNLIESQQFEIVDEGSYFIKPFTHNQMYELMKNGIINESVLDGLYDMEKYMPGLGSEIYVNMRRRKFSD